MERGDGRRPLAGALDPLPRFVKVEALDAHGTSMGSSAAVPTDS